MKRFGLVCLAGLVAVAVSLPVLAQEGAAPVKHPVREAVKKDLPPAEDVTVSGKITKVGERYVLVTKDGDKMPLPKKGDKDLVDVSKFVDKDVTVKGKASVMTHKGEGGKEVKKTIFVSIASIEEAAAAPAPAPAAPAAPATPK